MVVGKSASGESPLKGHAMKEHSMQKTYAAARRWIVVTVALLALLAGALSLTSCGTWHGLGKDVERTGEKMQDK
jgi:predicted small secreted protein